MDWARKQVRLGSTLEDDLLQLEIAAARRRCEQETGLSIAAQTLRLGLDHWPQYALRLPRPPCRAVTTVKYVDLAGVLQTWPSGQYKLDTDAWPARLAPASGYWWPSCADTLAAVQVTYEAGWARPELVPETLRQAILFLVAHYWTYREPVTAIGVAPLPLGVSDLLAGEWSGSLYLTAEG